MTTKEKKAKEPEIVDSSDVPKIVDGLRWDEMEDAANDLEETMDDAYKHAERLKELIGEACTSLSRPMMATPKARKMLAFVKAKFKTMEKDIAKMDSLPYFGDLASDVYDIDAEWLEDWKDKEGEE